MELCGHLLQLNALHLYGGRIVRVKINRFDCLFFLSVEYASCSKYFMAGSLAQSIRSLLSSHKVPNSTPQLYRELNLCGNVIFFSVYANSAFHPSEVGK